MDWRVMSATRENKTRRGRQGKSKIGPGPDETVFRQLQNDTGWADTHSLAKFSHPAAGGFDVNKTNTYFPDIFYRRSLRKLERSTIVDHYDIGTV